MTTGQPPLDINEAGRVMAQLNDWRAITFVLVMVIVLLLVERFWAQREARLERKEMMRLAQEFALNSGKVANALQALRTQVESLKEFADRVNKGPRK